MATEIKFCGLTRAVDVVHALGLGVDYLGVVLGPSPRRLELPTARRLLQHVGDGEGEGQGPRRVGVFVDPLVDEVQRAIDALRLHAVQLHGTPPPETIARIRESSAARIWCVIPVATGQRHDPDPALWGEVDVVLFDTSVAGRTGGTGRTFDWALARSSLDAFRGSRRIAVAGGLRPENVRAAIRTLSPDIVDVSSGIETAPGIKDHERMSAFVEAVRGKQDT